METKMKTESRIQENLKAELMEQRHNWLMAHMPWCGRVYAEIDLDAVRNNLTFEEAMALRQAGIVKPVLVLGYTFPYCYEEMVQREIRITVFRQDTLLEIAEAVRNLNKNGICKKAKVHIKVDTGMGRIGIRPGEDGIAFVKRVFDMQEVEAEGIFTHLARADETDKKAALRQVAVFKNFLKAIKESCGREILIKHYANSAGAIELPEKDMDAVRAGIILYGLWPSEQVNKDIVPLQPSMSLYSHIIY